MQRHENKNAKTRRTTIRAPQRVRNYYPTSVAGRYVTKTDRFGRERSYLGRANRSPRDLKTVSDHWEGVGKINTRCLEELDRDGSQGIFGSIKQPKPE